MGSVFKLALEFSLIDAASHGLHAIRDNVLSIAKANDDVRRSYDNMVSSGKYAMMTLVTAREMGEKLAVAVDRAAELQSAVLDVSANMGASARNASELAGHIEDIKKKSFEIQGWAPFKEEEIIAAEGQLVRMGISLKDIKGGAADAAVALAYVTKVPLETISEKLPQIATGFKTIADISLADKLSRAASMVPAAGREGLLETLTKAAPVASEVHRPVEEIMAMSVALSRLGIDGTAAGVGIRKFLQGASKHKEFKDAHGDLKSSTDILDVLHKKLDKMGEGEKVMFLSKYFDARSISIIIALLDHQEMSIKNITDGFRNQLSVQEKIKILNEGFTAQRTEMKNMGGSVFANLYKPALRPLTSIVEKTKDLLNLTGETAEKHKGIGKGVSYGSLAAEAGLGIAGVGLAGAALYYGRKVFKGVGGFKGLLGRGGGLAAGVAEGKALEKVAGVTPVFVTNWPVGVGNIAGAYSPLPPGAGGIKEGVKDALVVAATAGKGLWARMLGPVAAAGLGTTAFAAAGAGAAGYGAGRLAGNNIAWGGQNLDAHIQNLFARLFLSKKEQEAYFMPTINVQVNKDGQAIVEYKGKGAAKAKVNVERGKF